MSGWSSNSKYAIHLGAILRGSPNPISYEAVNWGNYCVSVVLFAGSLNLMEVTISQNKM